MKRKDGIVEFVFLGTSGWEQHPGLWCGCVNCEKARKLGGRNIRANACAWLQPDCLFDFPPQIFWQARQAGVDIREAKYLLVTHTHDDHFCPHWLWGRSSAVESDGGQSPRKSPIGHLTVFGNENVCAKTRKVMAGDPSDYAMGVELVKPFKTYDLGDLRFAGVPANHRDYDRNGLNYIVERNGRKMLYATDTGTILPESMEEIKKHRFDLVVLEGTYGLSPATKTHGNLQTVEETRDLFLSRNLLKKGAKFCVTHMSPHFTPVHDEIAPVMKKKGITIAYDGLKVKLS